MNCTEVGELMQRHLDYDLTETELEVMMTHLSGCAHCSDLYEKLTLLSGSLEQLPRVTPSISIVDAILPELELIDKARDVSLIVNKQRRNRWWTTIGSVATAAAIVVLMVKLNGTPGINSALVSDIAMNGNTGGQFAAADTNTSTASSNDIKSDSRYSDSSSTWSTVEQYGVTPSYGAKDSSKLDDPGMKDKGNSSRIEKNVSSPYEASNFGGNEGELSSDNNDALVPNYIGTLPSISSSQKMGLLGEELTPLDSQSPSDPQFSIRTIEEQHFSPDDKVYLLFELHTISVYETSSNNLLQQWDLPQEGTYEFLKWDTEGKDFAFQVTDDEGVITNYFWELQDKQ